MLDFQAFEGKDIFVKENSIDQTSQNNLQISSNFHPDLIKEELSKEIVKSLKTLQGSLKFQAELNTLKKKKVNLLLSLLIPDMTDLMCSKHANYFIQKIISKANTNQRLAVFESIKENFIQICKDPSGVHAVQGLVGAIKTSKEEKILENLVKSHLLELTCHENAHHLIQKIILDFPEGKRGYITKFIIENIDEISVNEYGYYCLFKFISLTEKNSIKKGLAKEMSLLTVFTKMVSNQFGAEILIHAIKIFGIVYFSDLFLKLKQTINLTFYGKLNEFSAGFVGKFFDYISKIDHSYYVNFIRIMLHPSSGFVESLVENELGQKLLVLLLNISDRSILSYFATVYSNSKCTKFFKVYFGI